MRQNKRGGGDRPPSDLPPLPSDLDAQKAAFAAKLRRLFRAKGWNQSELARQATQRSEIRVNRDDICGYLKGGAGGHKPTPPKLDALAKALGVSVDDLWPGASTAQAPAAPSIEMRQVEDDPGMALLRINKRVPYAKAIEVLTALRDDVERK